MVMLGSDFWFSIYRHTLAGLGLGNSDAREFFFFTKNWQYEDTPIVVPVGGSNISLRFCRFVNQAFFEDSMTPFSCCRCSHVPYCTILGTLPETNIAPENGWLGDEFLLGWPIFRCELLVLGRVFSPPRNHS